MIRMEKHKRFSAAALHSGGQDETFAIFALILLNSLAVQADWPTFRGPQGDGHVSAPGDTNRVGLPLTWSESQNVKWKTEISERGWSTPVVMNGQVWLTTAPVDGHDFYVLCVDAESG